MERTYRYLLATYAGFGLTVVLFALAGCGSTEDPFLVGDRKAFSEASPTAVVAGAEEATPESEQGPRGPSKDELIKFADWSDKRVKLTNYVAGYLIAHGLDFPVRMIDLEDTTYQDAWTNNDVDIVLEADPTWAKTRVEAGDLIELGTMAADNPDAKIVVHSRLAEYAPDVVEFLRGYVVDGESMNDKAKRISSRATGVRENIITYSFLKNEGETWTPWVSPAAAELVKAKVEKKEVSLCRRWEIYMPDMAGNMRVKYCVDDPSKNDPAE